MNPLPSTNPLDKNPTPHPPPPPPPIDPHQITPITLNLKVKHKAHALESTLLPEPKAPQAGPYFFYGSLLDPSLLTELLGLEREPDLLPASLDGYQCKLWGQYPALVACVGGTVQGAVYTVESVEDARKLADYETGNYGVIECDIMVDGGVVKGNVFLFVGNMRDLSEGEFELGSWKRSSTSMRREYSQCVVDSCIPPT